MSNLCSLRDEWMIERFSEAMGAASVSNNFPLILWKFHFTWKKKSDTLLPENYKALKPNWLLNWVSIARVVALFPQASWSLPAATAADSEHALCLCSLGSGPRYMICVTLFCTMRESENTWTCENCTWKRIARETRAILDPCKQSRRAAPRAWPLILPSKPSITFWNSLQRDCQMTGRGSNFDWKRLTNEL